MYNSQKMLSEAKMQMYAAIYCNQTDKSHGLKHVLKVWQQSITIYDRSEDPISLLPEFASGRAPWQKTELDLLYLEIGACLHDALDGKYHQPLSKEQIEAMITKHYPQEVVKFGMFIMDNISWSKEQKGQLNEHPTHYVLQWIISDADRLFAIGKSGIKRCIEYQSSHGYSIPKVVVEHCHEKLYKIPAFMRLGVTLDIIAEQRLMDPIDNYVQSNSTL